MPEPAKKLFSPEEEAEIERRVSERINALETRILDKLSGATGQAPSSGDEKWTAGLAMAIAQLTDQGTGRRRVAPEVMVSRDAAYERMVELLVGARASGDVPKYTLKNKVYLDEVLIDPIFINPVSKRHEKTEIEWPGVPNDMMEPINSVASAIYREFMVWVGLEKPTEAPKLEVTARGLTIVRGNKPAAESQEPGFVSTPAAAGSGLRINRGRGADAAYREVRVLGTVAQPAREQVA